MLHEWNLTPEYIINNWTDAKFNLMIDALSERLKPKKTVQSSNQNETRISDKAFFAKSSRSGKRRVTSGDKIGRCLT